MRVEVKSEVAGTVFQVEVSPGDKVAAGATLVLLELMKMEIPVNAPRAGTVSSIAVKAQDVVTEGQVLVVLLSE